jgi:hypothetical protein
MPERFTWEDREAAEPSAEKGLAGGAEGERSPERSERSERLREYITGLEALAIEKNLPASGENIVADLTANPPPDLPPASKNLLQRIRELPANVRSSLLGLTVAAEILGGGLVFAGQPSGEKQEYKTLRRVSPPAPPRVTLGDRSIIVQGESSGLFARHNLRRPESLLDFGKMLVEPASIGMKFRLGRESWPARILTGSDETDPFLFALDVPYEYARDFERASPVDRRKMQEDMASRAQALLEQVLPLVFGLTVHQNEVRQDMSRYSVSRLDTVSIDGFASGESDRGVDTDDPRNQRLSELRAENAAQVLEQLFRERGVAVNEIRHRGQGELHLLSEERRALLQDATELKIGPDGLPENKLLLELIKKYNAGQIKPGEALERLEQMVGGKRKVAIKVQTEERDFVLVLPVIPIPPRRLLEWFRGWFRGQPGRVYAHFLPHTEQNRPLSPPERRQARAQGSRLRNDEGVTNKVSRLRDTIKGYSAPGESSAETRDEVVAGARHLRKRAGRERLELAFDPNLSGEQRLRGLAYLVNHYGHLATRILRPGGRRDFDLVNVYHEPQLMERLLNDVVRRQPNDPPIRIGSTDDVYFEMYRGPFRRGQEVRVEGGMVVPAPRGSGRRIFAHVGRAMYQVDPVRLEQLAGEYQARRVRLANPRGT